MRSWRAAPGPMGDVGLWDRACPMSKDGGGGRECVGARGRGGAPSGGFWGLAALVAVGACAWQQDFVDHVDHAVGGLDICDHDIGAVAAPVCD